MMRQPVICSLLFVLCSLISVSASAKSNPVRGAEKLIGDYSKIDDARRLINEGLTDSILNKQACTLYTAARIEREAYRHFYKLLSINRRDPKVDHVAMSDALLAAHKYFLRTMALDTITDKRGHQKVTYSPEIALWISASAPAFYNAGIAYMNKKLYYPQAYTAFTTYASLPDFPYFHPAQALTDSLRANAYFYGGVMAYNAHQWEPAMDAFRRARALGYNKKEVYLNEISSLAQTAQTDTLRRDSLSNIITCLAGEALRIHGIKQTPIFARKYVAGLIVQGQPADALPVLDSLLALQDTVPTPELSLLHTLKANIYTALGNEHEALKEFVAAAELPCAESETLKAAAAALAQTGIRELDAVKGRSREARNRAKAVREKYLSPSLEFAQRALKLTPNDPDLPGIIDTITYRLH